MRELSKINIDPQEIILGVHKSFLAIRLLEDGDIGGAEESLTLALNIFQKLLIKKVQIVPIAYEISTDTKEYFGADWTTKEIPYREVVILKQLLTIEDYTFFSAKALNALDLWKDIEKAQQELKSALSTLSYELVTFKI